MIWQHIDAHVNKGVLGMTKCFWNDLRLTTDDSANKTEENSTMLSTPGVSHRRKSMLLQALLKAVEALSILTTYNI